MTELYTIIQRIMMFLKNGQKVDVTLKDGTEKRGTITNFSGTEFVLDDSVIQVNDIVSIIESREIILNDYLLKRVEIATLASDVIDAVLISASDEEITYITEDGQKSLKLAEIKQIQCEGMTIYAERSAVEAIPEDSGKLLPKEESSITYEPNDLEKELIRGNKKAVEAFVSQDAKLQSLGYSEKEIDRIKKAYLNAPWGEDLYSIATRINHFQLNKHGLAREYYEKTIENCSKGSPEYGKALNVIAQRGLDSDEYEYIAFWKKYSAILKENTVFCSNFISALMKSKGIKANAFETAVINGDKTTVSSFFEEETSLESLGYSADDISRARKAYKISNWEISWYRTATRLYGMQLNKNGLAELYYEAALVVANKKSEEYLKILNALASIKAAQDSDSYITFFNKYREKLKNNANYCMAYANALMATQNVEKIVANLPMLRKQLANYPAFLDRIDGEVEYYKNLPPFKIDKFVILSNRLTDPDLLYDQEKELIERLPEKKALKALLDVYYFNKNEDAYFELLKYALFFVKEEKTSMEKLCTVLTDTDNIDAFVYFMDRVPVFWGNESLINKYLRARENEGGEIDNPRLKGHIRSIAAYSAPNGFENSIINQDINATKDYFDKPYLLEEMGYSDAEIEDIKMVDVNQLFSEDCYTMKRILAFQGNKNHIAEQFLFEAFYSNKIDMCNRLFPLLLDENRGDLILSLFVFDHTLKSKMPSLKRLYYLALCMAEEDNEKFYREIESEWMDYPDDIILDRLLTIARDKNDKLLVRQIETQKKKPRGNEFEAAIIAADNDTIRKYIKSADLLVELGYTPEEIQKINKIFASGAVNNGSKPGQIANRVYLYQKNKNSLAERLYLKAITEDSPEDVINDYKALYQIYIGQHNYEMVCKLYEDYLHEKKKEKFNGTYASSYCIALYETGRYKDFLKFYEQNRKRWENFTLYTNLLYVCEVLGTHEYDEEIWENIMSNSYRTDIIAKYIQYVLDTDPERIFSERIIDLINRFFVRFSKEDIEMIKSKTNNINVQNIVLPRGGLIYALVSEADRSEALSRWLDYIEESIDLNTKINLFIMLAGIFPDASETVVNRAIDIYRVLDRDGINEFRLDALEELIAQNISRSNEKVLWYQIQTQLLQEGKGSIKSLRNYLTLSQSIGSLLDFWGVYLAFKKNAAVELKPDALFGVVWDYYGSTRDESFLSIKKDIVLELVDLSGRLELDHIGCKNLSVICAECGMEFEAKVYLQASNRLVNHQNDLTLSGNQNTEKPLDYYAYLLGKLHEERNTDLSRMFWGWSKYLQLSDEEMLIIERLRNTIKDSDRWEAEEISILSKAIICEPINSAYWKLLKTWIEKNEVKNNTVIGNILFQIAVQNSNAQEKALEFAIDNDLKGIALKLLMKMLDAHGADITIAAQKNLRLIIQKNWFSISEYRDMAGDMLRKIRDSISLSSAEDLLWNSVCAATDLASATEEYELYISLYAEYLSKSCAKQCSAIIADMILKDKTSGIEAAFNCLNSALLDIPYKSLVSDIYEKYSKHEISEYEKKALLCIKRNYGNLLGVNDLLGFYCEMSMTGQKRCGFEMIRLLIEYDKNDPVLYEVAACFLRDEKGLEENVMYYDFMYDYLESIQNDNPVEYIVGSMVCGENYLRLNGKDVRPIKSIIEERFSDCADLVKKYQEFCDRIVVGLRTTDYEDFAPILFRAVFSGDWVDVFEYKSADSIVNTVLENNIRTDRINVADDYYRSVIKGVALFALNHSDNMWDFLDNSGRVRILWNSIFNGGCNFDYFTNYILSLDDEAVSELKKIWMIDIETQTVFKKFFGKCILSQKNCCNYPEIFSVFINARGGDIFTNIETQEYLKSIDKNSSIAICETYERLYIRAAGPIRLNSTGKGVNKDSDYESNVFSDFLRRNTIDYNNSKRRCQRFKNKYELIAQLYNINSLHDANDERFDINRKRQIFSVRSLYFYYSFLADEVDIDVFRPDNNIIEIINAITIALSDDTYISELNSFISKFDEDARLILGVLILIEQESIDKAAQRAIELFTGKTQGYLCAKIAAAYGKIGKTKDLCRQCKEISKAAFITNNYWIKNYKHCKSINKINAETYLSNRQNEPESAEDDSRIAQGHSIAEDSSGELDALQIDVPEEKIEEEISFEIPAFLRGFLEKEHKEEKLREYKKEWEKAKALLDNGSGTQESLNEISINIGIIMMKRQEAKIDESIMRDTFSLIRKYSIQDKYLINALHDIFQKYISGYSDLDSLSRSVYENREALQHLGYEQDMDRKSRVSQDIGAASVLIEVLTNIANDLSSAIGEESVKERLRSYQEELYRRTTKVSKFRNASNTLGKMIQEKIKSINYVPHLLISHLGSAGAGNSGKNNWKEIWLEGAEKGYVRGVVFNSGGAPAVRVELSITVNSVAREKFIIDRIEPGREIPFAVPYTARDIVDSKVSWGADVTYYYVNNVKAHSSNVYGEIEVELSDEEWGISHVGRGKFNTQLAAEGDDFCGRTNELLKLENLYNVNNDPDRYPSLLVTGLRRAGKSSVIKFFRDRLRERDNLAPIFVDAQGINGDIANAFFNLTFNELYRCYKKQIMEGFVDFKKRWEAVSRSSDWIGLLPTYFMELSELLGGRKVIFILDEMENVFYANHFDNAQHEEQFFGMIRSVIQNYQEFVSFIFCGSDKLLTSCLEQKRESQMFQVLQRIYVGRMSISDIRDMFDKYNKEYDIKFGDDAIDAIWYYTNGLIWYTKVIAYNILDKIIDQEHIIRDEIHIADVNMIVELLIKGDLGSELIDLLDNNFGAKRKAIIRAMARVTKKPNDSVNEEMILVELNKQNYVDNDTGEVLGSITMEDLRKNLNVLEKMDFIIKDPHQENSYSFSTELYRLLMLQDRRIDKFIKVKE